MKKYYDKLSKEDKTAVKKEYLDKNGNIYNKAKKIIILCIIGMLFGLGSFIFDYIYQSDTINYILDGLLFVFSIIVMLRMIMIQKNILNEYALSKKKKSK